MPLTTDVINAPSAVVAQIVAEVPHRVEGVIDTLVDFNNSERDLRRHIADHNNPHEVTAEQTGAVPKTLRELAQLQAETMQVKSLREMAMLYVDNNGVPAKISLQDIKQMNSLIIDRPTESQLSNLAANDYILS